MVCRAWKPSWCYCVCVYRKHKQLHVVSIILFSLHIVVQTRPHYSNVFYTLCSYLLSIHLLYNLFAILPIQWQNLMSFYELTTFMIDIGGEIALCNYAIISDTFRQFVERNRLIWISWVLLGIYMRRKTYAWAVQ